MSNNYNQQNNIRPVTQRFILNDSIKGEIHGMVPKFGFNGLGEVVFRRTYSRGNENWSDVVIRVIEGVMTIRKEHYYRNSLYWNDEDWQVFARQMGISLFNMEWLPPGRGLWMMGTDFVYERGSMALNNCGAVDTQDDLVLTAEWTMDALMNGVGVGFSTTWKGTAERPNKEDTEVFTIPDSREGWVSSLIKLLSSYVHSNRYGKCKFPTFDYSLIREPGTPIKGFGGLASGYEPLKKMHTRIEQFLDNFCNGFIEVDGVQKPYDHTRLVTDIFNSIGACVVAGNVRRCLPENSLVHTDRGLVPIQEVKIGDSVLTMKGYEKVSNTFKQGKQNLIKIITQDGEFRCTPNHRMAVNHSNEYTWKQASSLRKGEKLISLNPTTTNFNYSENTYYLSEIVKVVEDVEEETYDIEVENRHEFFCNGYLTHNSAEIAMGDVHDKTFLNLKNYEENPERGDIAWMSNNSVVLKSNSDYEDFSYIPEIARRIRDNGEPGIINLYNMQKYGRYGKELKDEATLTNPCFSGETLIAVADGRNYVSIAQLAKEGKDVPVYSIDPATHKVSIQWGRNPRITGYKQKLLRIHFQGSHSRETIDVTPNHKFYTNDGRVVLARDLKEGDSIPQFKTQGTKILNKGRPISKGFLKSEFEKIEPLRVSGGFVEKMCENCATSMKIPYNLREKSYCSSKCAVEAQEKLKTRIKKEICKNKVENCYSVFYTEEMKGGHTVYNITVDKNHTLAIVTDVKTNYTKLPVTDNKLDSYLKNCLSGIFAANCGEIALCSFELCNLSEVFPPRCKNQEVFFNALKYATFYSSSVSLLPTHRPETNAIVAKNRRIGVSISGIAQWASGEVDKEWGHMNYTRMTTLLRRSYKTVKEENVRLANHAGVPPSIRVTTVKPSGSISLLAGVTPGIHYPVSRYAIRRMRIGKDSPLVPALIEAKIPHEKDSYSDNTLVFEFVIDHGNVRPCEEVSPWEQFSLAATLQRTYSDNCVSCTIYFHKEKDATDVEKLLAMYIPILKSVSMLPHSNHGYVQAPYEPIDEETYKRRLSEYTQLNFEKVQGNIPVGSKYCTNDTCEL